MILLFVANSLYSQFHNDNFDFSGIDQFWKVLDQLKKDRNPGDELWEKMFNTPGYKTLITYEYSKDFFKQNFYMAFSPSKKKELAEAKKIWKNAYYLTHYEKVLENQQLLLGQVGKLKMSNMNNQAVNLALNFLPVNNIKKFPRVSFVIFANDGRGYSPIIIDLYATIETDFIPFLAHEYHHWYRNDMFRTSYKRIEPDDEGIFELLNQLEAEGIADQIDKATWIKNSSHLSEREKQYVALVKDSPAILKKMNQLLEGIVENNQKRKMNFAEIKNTVPQGGHPTGYFMADMILHSIGRNELVKTVGKPFDFIRLFNKAAMMSGKSDLIFSNKAMKVIDGLERKYIL